MSASLFIINTVTAQTNQRRQPEKKEESGIEMTSQQERVAIIAQEITRIPTEQLLAIFREQTNNTSHQN